MLYRSTGDPEAADMAESLAPGIGRDANDNPATITNRSLKVASILSDAISSAVGSFRRSIDH